MYWIAVGASATLICLLAALAYRLARARGDGDPALAPFVVASVWATHF